MSGLREAKISKTQLGIYMECINNPESTLYNLPFLGTLGNDIDAERLKNAIEKVLKVRLGLCTILYTNDNGEVMQKIADELGISQSYISRLEKKIIGKMRKDIMSKTG